MGVFIVFLFQPIRETTVIASQSNANPKHTPLMILKRNVLFFTGEEIESTYIIKL
jgi:hypothetical protein